MPAYRAALLYFSSDDRLVYESDGLLVTEADHRGVQRVKSIGPWSAVGSAHLEVEHSPGRIIAPGFVDLHIHYPQVDVIASPADVESITVDWDVSAAAVHTRVGIEHIEARTAKRVVTTGCGQGTVFGDVMAGLEAIELPSAAQARIRQSTLHAVLETMRQQDSVHRRAGSVHGCALFKGAELLMFVEDVGRHNAIDAIAGWMALNGVGGGDKLFYTTGRLTSEMVMKAAHMGVPIIVSRNGVTQMGHDLASGLGMTLFGRASNRHFLCYCGFDRFDSEPEPMRPTVRVVSSSTENPAEG